MTIAAGPDLEPQQLTHEQVLRKPWKYLGYQEFARYVSSDDDFLALRRFDRLHCRLLLRLQDQVAELEEQLEAIDSRSRDRSAEDIDNGSVRKDIPERKQLLDRLHELLGQYDELLCRFTQLKARPKASWTSTRNIKTWLSNNNSPIHPSEAEFVNAADLISIAKSPKSIFRQVIEQRILVPTRGLFGLVNQAQTPDLHSFKATVVGTDEHVDILATVMIFLIAAVMLVVRLWVLAITQVMFQKLAVITVFVTVFLVVLTWGTLAKPFEILTATAGNSAVLVVFLQVGATVQPGWAHHGPSMVVSNRALVNPD